MKTYLKWMTSAGWAKDIWGNVQAVPYLALPEKQDAIDQKK